MRTVGWLLLAGVAAPAVLGVAGCGDERKVAPAAPQPPAASFEARTDPLIEDKVAKLLYAARYEELEAELARSYLAYRSDVSTETVLNQAYDAFGEEDARLREEIDAWVSARPGVYQARLARAMNRVESAWRRRGRKFRQEVAAEAIQDFQRLLDLARGDAEAVLAGQPAHPVAWRTLVRVAGGVGGAQALPELIERLDREAPQSYLARKTVLNYLQPRWGGNYEAMEAYARMAQAGIASNPRLQVLLGFPHWARGLDLHGQDEDALAVRSYDRALEYGEDTDFLDDRARALVKLLRFKEAMADFERNSRRFPSRETVRALEKAQKRMREEAYGIHRSKDYRRAARAYDAFLEVWPGDVEVLLYQAHVLDDLDRHTEALRNFRRVIALDPSNFEAVRGADHALAREQRWAEILPLWEAYLARVPDKAEAYMERGGTYFHMGNRAEALANATKACELGLQTGCTWKQRLGGTPAN